MRFTHATFQCRVSEFTEHESFHSFPSQPRQQLRPVRHPSNDKQWTYTVRRFCVHEIAACKQFRQYVKVLPSPPCDFVPVDGGEQTARQRRYVTVITPV